MARVDVRTRASPRPACDAPVRRLPARRRAAMMRALSGWGRAVAPVGAIFAVVVAVAAVWLALDRRPPEWDHANHLQRAVACAVDLGRGDWRTLLDRSSFYPPLAPCVAGIFYLALPSDAVAAQAAMLL